MRDWGLGTRAVSLDEVRSYFFVHVLVTLEGPGRNVDCCYSDSELSVVRWRVRVFLDHMLYEEMKNQKKK